MGVEAFGELADPDSIADLVPTIAVIRGQARAIRQSPSCLRDETIIRLFGSIVAIRLRKGLHLHRLLQFGQESCIEIDCYNGAYVWVYHIITHATLLLNMKCTDVSGGALIPG